MTPVFIQAVPWVPERTMRAVELMRQTDGRIIWDQDFNAYATYLDLLRAVGDGPAIMLEDDVELAPEWREKVEAEVALHPDSVIQMFSIRCFGPPHSRWSSPRTFWCHQCWYMPPGFAKALLDYSPTYVAGVAEGARPLTDHLTNEYLKSTQTRYWQRATSLAQHMPFKSTIQKANNWLRESFFDTELCAGEPVDIPSTLHQIWVGSEPPRLVRHSWEQWDQFLEENHPDWKVIRWLDADVRREFPDAVSMAESGLSPRGLADLVRVRALLEHGGVYCDYDTLPLRDLSPMVGHRPAWTSYLEVGGSASDFVGSSPGHPALRRVWDYAVDKVRAGVTNEFHIAGPRVYTVQGRVSPDLRAPSTGKALANRWLRLRETPDYDRLREEYPNAVVLGTYAYLKGDLS